MIKDIITKTKIGLIIRVFLFPILLPLLCLCDLAVNAKDAICEFCGDAKDTVIYYYGILVSFISKEAAKQWRESPWLKPKAD